MVMIIDLYTLQKAMYSSDKKEEKVMPLSLGAFHKLRLQLGWVGSQQNANQCKLRVRRSFWKCLRLQKSYFF